MTVESLQWELDRLEEIESATKLAQEHGVNLKTVIKHLGKAHFVHDGIHWIRLVPSPQPVIKLQVENMTKGQIADDTVEFIMAKPIPKSFDGIVMLIPRDFIVRVKEIATVRRLAALVPKLEEVYDDIRQTKEQDQTFIQLRVKQVILNGLLDMVDNHELSWAEHNILTSEGFMPISRRLPPLPQVPNYTNQTNQTSPTNQTKDKNETSLLPQETSHSRLNP